MATIIIGVFLVSAVVLALFAMRRQKRKGSSCSCSGGCSSCPGCSASAECKTMGGLGSDCSRLG